MVRGGTTDRTVMNMLWGRTRRMSPRAWVQIAEPSGEVPEAAKGPGGREGAV
jgi:hypothetical protein